MITDKNILLAGNTLKPHGINGELVASFDYDVTPDELSCLIFKVDGINVPFFIESWRPKGHENFLLKFDGITNETEAETLANQDFWALRNELPGSNDSDTDGFFVGDLLGWTIEDNGKVIGKVTDFDDSTSNLLLILERPDGSTLMIPLADDLIEDIDSSRQVLLMNLPIGL